MRVGQLVTLDKGLSYRGHLLGDVGRPLLNLGDFGGRALDAPRRYAGRHLDRHLVAPGDLLLAASDLSQRRELLGTPLLAPALGGDDDPAPHGDRALLFSQHAYAVRLRVDGDGWREFLYFALRQPAFRARAAAFATGTTVLALPRDAVLDHALAVPPARLRAEFAAFARPLLERIELARRESRTLATMRDHALPDLISGTLTPPALGGPRATP
jgi:type I restriction enzyme S subunit